MATTRPSVPASAVLDGVELGDATEWRVGGEDLRTVPRLATGARREILAYQAPDLPPKARKRAFTLAWRDITGTERERIEELLAVPGEHRLILWREEQLAWLGDGARREFRLPNGWSLATDVTVPPDGLGVERFAPRLKIGRGGELLNLAPVDAATYDAGDPPAGTAWFRPGGDRFQIGDIPPKNAWLYGRIVPAYRVLEDVGVPDKRLARPTTEPHELRFTEV